MPEELDPVSRTDAGEESGCLQLGDKNTLATSPAPALTCTLILNKSVSSDQFVNQTVSYAPKTKTKKPRVFIFGKFRNEKTEKTGLFHSFLIPKPSEKFFGFSFRCVRNGLIN